MVILFIYALLQSFFTEVLLCDGLSIHEVDISQIDLADTEPEYYGINNTESIGLIPKCKFILRRRLHWYFIGKSSGDFESYEDYKTYWDPSVSLRNQLKENFRSMLRDPIGDFRATRVKAAKDRAKTRELDRQLELMRNRHNRVAQQLAAQRLYDNTRPRN